MCIFCQIIQGDIPGHVVYEDDQVLAILDISQVTKGHTLVMPKKHVSNLITCDEETYMQVMKAVKKLGTHMLEKTGAEGLNVLSNIHEAAGQTVDHFHVHLIPRYNEQDAVEFTFHESPEQNLAEVAELIHLDK